MAYEYERDEWRDARRRSGTTPCYRHDYVPNRTGGGTCLGCGATVGRDEL